MRIILSLLLLLSSFNYFARGQPSENYIDTIRNKALSYLEMLYVEHNFEEASKNWSPRRVLEILDYKKPGIIEPSYPQVLISLKKSYKSYFHNVKKFNLSEPLDVGNIEHQDSLLRSFISYNFTEFYKGIKTIGNGILIFYSNDNGITWMIADIRIHDIDKKNDY